MAEREDDDIDLERAAMDPDYRRKVLRRLKAEAEGRESSDDDPVLPGRPDTRRRGPKVKPPRR